MSFFTNPPAGTQPQSGGHFGSSNTSSNTSTNPPSFFGGAGGLFGGQNNASASATGGQSATSATTPNAAATTAPASLFGATSTATGTTSSATGSTPSAPSGTASTNPLFGGSSGGFSLPKPADQSTGAAKPTSSFFSQPPATGSASTGGLFGAPKPADSSTSTTGAGTSTGSSVPSTGLFGGSLFSKPSASATSTTTTPAASAEKKDATTTSTAPAGGLFSSFSSTTTKPAESKESGTAPAPAPSFNLFGGPKPDDKKDKEAAKPPEITIGTSATAASMPAAAVAVPPPSMLKGKTLEEIVNRWSSELETHVREFNKFAGEVAVWDRALIENGNNLAALYSHVLAAEREQEDINQSLDHIEQQQKDLSSTLAAYEKVAQEIIGNQGGNLRLDTGPADTERDKNYMLATDLYTHLDDLSGSLTQMIEAVNGLSLPGEPNAPGPGDDPMGQIAQILSSHLESLQWIDGAVREVESKVVEVEKRVKDSGYSLSNGAGFKNRGFGLNR